MSDRPRVLVVDDERQILRALKVILREAGYDVIEAVTMQEALDRAAVRPPDAAIVDLMLPDGSGVELCRRLREWTSMPILVLSAVGEEDAKVEALEAGADDYVTKPFGPDELLARIRVALRRVTAEEVPESGHLQAGDLVIDYDRRRVTLSGEELRLTPKELELLSLLARNHDRVLTHRAILKAIWGPNAVDQPEHLWALVAQLRKKIEPDPSAPRYLVSEPWVGYRFVS